ncbi:MAG: hypothetical protein KGH49_01260 [Candidatus Micrarchaeota archaeon]|nr:hypothetical protein [Candidatus Micrarchaeota archaeon]
MISVGRMRAQSSIEFLTTYSFLFLIIGVILSFLFFFSTAPRSTIPSQCTSFSGPMCMSTSDYINTSAGYSLLTFSLANSESVPINITSVSTLINSANSIAGGCTPKIVYPGGYFTCIAAMSRVPSVGSLVSGTYTINALACNGGINSFSNNCTGGASVLYGGSFSTQAVNFKDLIFSVIALQGPTTQQNYPYVSNPLSLPSGWTRVQNSAWTSGFKGYAFVTQPYVGGQYWQFIGAPFPATLSSLSNNAIAGAPPYNSMASLAYTAVYVPPSGSLGSSVAIWTNDHTGVYTSTDQRSWTSATGGSYLYLNKFGYNSLTLGTGINYVAIVWDNVGGGGVQIVNFTGSV